MIKAQTVKSTLTSVEADINARPEVIWGVLTNTRDYPKWNSTVVSVDGEIGPGNMIKLVSKLDPKRTFRLKVKAFVPNKILVWGDSMGKRTYTLEERGEITHFSMVEKIGGPIFPLFASKIPSFDESFEQFVNDLKKETEK